MGEKREESRSRRRETGCQKRIREREDSGREGLQGKRDGEGIFGEVATDFLFGCSCDIFRKTYSHYPHVGVEGCLQGALGRGTGAPPLTDG